MKGIFSKILAVLIIGAILVYLGFQVVSFIRPDLKVETATLYTAYNDIMASGFMIRDEMIIPKAGDGTYDVSAADGERVKKGGVIATVYKSSEQADINTRIKKLDKQIERLAQSSLNNTMGSVEVEKLESNIAAAISTIAADGSSGNGSEALAAKDELTVLLNKKSLLLGEVAGFDDLIEQLKGQRAQLSAKAGGGISTVTAPVSGCFVGTADGYEDMFKPAMVDSLTPEDLDSASKVDPKAAKNDNIMGKVITGFQWYFAAAVPEDQVEGLSKGSAVSLRFPFALGITVPAEVAAISAPQDGRCVISVCSNYELAELNLIRNQTVQIIKNTRTGLKISKEAIRVKDGQQGVYVRSGSVLKWKPVSIDFSRDNYYIVKYDKDNKNALSLYDLVAVSGRDLYDGKVFN